MNNRTILILGDMLTLTVVTVVGFATHGETGLSFLPRMAAAFFPLCMSWFLLAPWFGLFRDETTRSAHQLWRPALAMIFAGPLAVVLRGLILGAAVLPVFAVVLSLTSALGVTVWRALYVVIKRALRGAAA